MVITMVGLEPRMTPAREWTQQCVFHVVTEPIYFNNHTFSDLLAKINQISLAVYKFCHEQRKQ